MIVAFTGHRPDKLGGYGAHNPVRDRVKAALADTLTRLLDPRQTNLAISGMALGFDQWAAEVCLDLRIPFIAAIPFAGQASAWPLESQRHYADLLRRALNTHVVCDGGYAAWKMSRRNEWMVDKSEHLIAAWDGTSGGTANCVAYACKQDRAITRLAW